MDKNELKIRALLQSTGELTSKYENELANIRVELHVAAKQIEQFQQENERLRDELVQAKGDHPDTTGSDETTASD